ncbi:MAG: alpha/beta hydrolase [Eubacterium sp.]|nr:alpha/beta hydrolase [Eubacterium sp.]
MKLCVLFPGVGYTVDRPLLYYSKKKALKLGYEVIELKFKDLPKDIKGDKEKQKEAYRLCLEQAEKKLKDIDWGSYSDILFVGKSIGTVIAASYAQSIEDKLKTEIRFLYMTPLAETFSLARPKSGIVFTGTADPWVVHEEIVEAAKKLELPCYIYENANHSLETGDVARDIEIAGDVMSRW